MMRMLLRSLPALVILAMAISNASAGSKATDVSQPAPSPTAATQAFGHWLNTTYGQVQGYWTCPPGQIFGQKIFCQAEVRVGQTWHLTSATATLFDGRVVFPKNSDQAWVRRWSAYSRHYLVRGGAYTVPGLISVNGPAFDWAWLALGAHANWKHHRTFHLDGYDGMGKGLMRFYDFACSVRQNTVSCRNVFGDAMRYIATS
jgi:hypothetical protein